MQLAGQLDRIWGEFQTGWEEFARKAGTGEVVAARHSSLVNFHEFAAGGVERTAGLDPNVGGWRSEEFFGEVTAELFGLLAGSVSDGSTHPLFDNQVGDGWS